MRRQFLQTTSLAAAAALGGAPARGQRRGPNVVLIMTDDQGWGDVTSHGNELLDTPTLDRIAGEGARFDRFSVSPVCAPTRAALLTGRDHLRTGTCWVTGGLETMRASEVTVAEALRRGGYATGCFGKWHNGAHWPHHPNAQGFDEFYGFCAGHWNNYFDTTLERNGAAGRSSGYITDVLTDAALGFIEQNRSQPFFCYVPYNAPHCPFQVPDRYFDKYRNRDCDALLASVYGMVGNIDDNVARILGKLDELKLSEDTIVLFLCDNGPNTERYNGGMRGRKGSVHEGGVRVPMFVRWPGHIDPGTEVPQIAAHHDLMPTLLELCGVPAPDGPPMDGISLAPLLFGEEPTAWDRTLFTHQSRNGGVHPSPGAVRTQQHRLVNGGEGYELYDMVADPGQKANIADQHPDVVAQLGKTYEEWFASATEAGFDRIPVPVGHEQAPSVELQAPESFFRGDTSFKGKKGWANDWITGYAGPEDTSWWDLEVVREGRYEVTLMYCCPEEEVGSTVQAEVGGETLEGKLTEPYDPEPLPSPDRVPRGEAYEKEWAPLTLGEVELKAGRQDLTVRAAEVAGENAMDLKSVWLRRVE